ncbi:hypothetical protein HUG10_21425 (plasmid) [Halorarum halophilum]|uniref:Uncharacterized protein n=1 Tax=Halorarum halophilum TaxID=2743090 RepID=A0A7D5GKX6_9EURY|nr:hypothetical protein [Halobaculum halophilum]QLG30151.1 hypothetical protein HUG10_21425 [Halobaculum halophilum]
MTDEFVPVRREVAVRAARELGETAEYCDSSEQMERIAQLLEAVESIQRSLDGDHEGKLSHPDQETCVREEAFLDRDSVIEEMDGVGWYVTRSCPVCNRCFVYVYEFEGIFDTDEQEYVDHQTYHEYGLGDMDWDTDEGYYGDLDYSIPATDNARFERVYIMDRILNEHDELVRSI